MTHANPLFDLAVPRHGHGDPHRRGMVAVRAGHLVADSLTVSPEALEALAAGETIVAITARNAVNLNDEVELAAEGAPPRDLVALVVAVQPAASMGTAAGDAVLLRVFKGLDPVVPEEAFAAMRSEVEAAWR